MNNNIMNVLIIISLFLSCATKSNDEKSKNSTFIRDSIDCMLENLDMSLVEFKSINIPEISEQELIKLHKVDCEFYDNYLRFGEWGFKQDCNDTELYIHSRLNASCALVLVEKDERINSMKAYLLIFSESGEVNYKIVLSENSISSGGITYSHSRLVNDSVIEMTKINGFVGGYDEKNDKYETIEDSVHLEFSIDGNQLKRIKLDSVRIFK